MGRIFVDLVHGSGEPAQIESSANDRRPTIDDPVVYITPPASLPRAQSATPASPYAAAARATKSLAPAPRPTRTANRPPPPPHAPPAPQSHRLLAVPRASPDCLLQPITP